MKAIFSAMVLMVSAQMAQAEGFICTSESGLVVRAYNHTDANQGTRSAAIMVISDSSVGSGNKTIASFTDAKHTLGLFKIDLHCKSGFASS